MSVTGKSPRIVRFEIKSMPHRKWMRLLGEMRTVTATFDNGMRRDLFSFSPDEIMFSEDEVVGLTEQEADELRRLKNLTFLQSSHPHAGA